MSHSQGSFEVISSLHNPKVKNTIALQKSRERKKQNLFVVEGRREIERAMQGGYSFNRIFVCRELYGDDLAGPGLVKRDAGHFPLHMVDFISPKVYGHMAYRGTTEGILAWVVQKDHSIENIILSENPLILVVDAVEKPGNLGAILRTADAAGVDALIISDTRTDLYNPNAVRSSLGALFTTQIGTGETGQVIQWLRKNLITIYCTALSASIQYTEVDYREPCAIVMGTEATGLKDAWLSQSDRNIIIPMHGTVDSMNVSVSTGVVLFEAVRQRH